MDAVFRYAAEALEHRVEMPAPGPYELLRAREQQGSTVLSPQLPVPHVVIQGEHVFELLLVRTGEGIRFSDEAPQVTTLFVLVGTPDERNFLLRALASIAQIVSRSDFEKKWLAARGDQALRDLLPLGKRRREA